MLEWNCVRYFESYEWRLELILFVENDWWTFILKHIVWEVPHLELFLLSINLALLLLVDLFIQYWLISNSWCSTYLQPLSFSWSIDTMILACSSTYLTPFFSNAVFYLIPLIGATDAKVEFVLVHLINIIFLFHLNIINFPIIFIKSKLRVILNNISCLGFSSGWTC